MRYLTICLMVTALTGCGADLLPLVAPPILSTGRPETNVTISRETATRLAELLDEDRSGRIGEQEGFVTLQLGSQIVRNHFPDNDNPADPIPVGQFVDFLTQGGKAKLVGAIGNPAPEVFIAMEDDTRQRLGKGFAEIFKKDALSTAGIPLQMSISRRHPIRQGKETLKRLSAQEVAKHVFDSLEWGVPGIEVHGAGQFEGQPYFLHRKYSTAF